MRNVLNLPKALSIVVCASIVILDVTSLAFAETERRDRRRPIAVKVINETTAHTAMPEWFIQSSSVAGLFTNLEGLTQDYNDDDISPIPSLGGRPAPHFRKHASTTK